MRHWTVDDLDDLPHGDGNRYEIVDGALVVTGLPVLRHQRALGRLAMVLDLGCPPGYEVFVGPFAVVLADDTVMQPDILVARVEDLTETELPAPPVLAVEVLSTGSRNMDLDLKPRRYARAGTPAYWVVEPAAEPDKARLTGWELTDGEYRQVGAARGNEEYAATLPYPITVVPSTLVR